MDGFDCPNVWVYLHSSDGARCVVGAVFVHQGSIRKHHGVPHKLVRLTEWNGQEPLGEPKEKTHHASCRGSVMVPRRRNAITTQTLQRSPEHVLVLRWVLVSGPITALADASPRCKVPIFGRCTSGREEGPQGCKGSVNPLALRRRRTIAKP